jgi:hypothetical protein
MGLITVEIHDATGNKRQPVEMPDDAPLNRLLTVLLEKMRFPHYGPDGQLLSYKLHHRASGKQLLDGQTLAAAGVKPGDILRLMPEITAGGLPVADRQLSIGRRTLSDLRLPIRTPHSTIGKPRHASH